MRLEKENNFLPTRRGVVTSNSATSSHRALQVPHNLLASIADTCKEALSPNSDSIPDTQIMKFPTYHHTLPRTAIRVLNVLFTHVTRTNTLSSHQVLARPLPSHYPCTAQTPHPYRKDLRARHDHSALLPKVVGHAAQRYYRKLAHLLSATYGARGSPP